MSMASMAPSRSLHELEAAHEPLPLTACVATPNGGRHFYFRRNGVEIRNSAGKLATGLDIRGDGGYVLAPPSRLAAGRYARCQAGSPVPMPEWLLKRLNGARNGSRDRSGWQTPAPMVEGDIPEHERNSTLASLAGTMRRRGFHEDAISAALLVTNRDRCKPPLDDADVRAIAHSVAPYDPSAEAVGSLDELTALLALDTVGKRIDVVRLYGRGSNAIAHIYLDDGERIVLDPVGKFTTCSKMNAEVAIQAGASVTLRPPDVTRVLVLLRNLS